jgi:predicted kinase
MRKLIIMRGLPGSGKSFLAKQEYVKNSKLGLSCVICSTDAFWLINESYTFKPEYLGIAHQWNQGQVAYAMFQNTEVIIVDNTNTTFKEMAPYLELAASFGYRVELMEPVTPWAHDPVECARRNTHGVPEAKIREMLARWQNIEISTGPWG